MKYILPILFVIFFISCENTQVQEPNNKLIGSVNVELLRAHESGVILGKFYPSYYLSGVKVDLMKNGNVIKTTYTVVDTNVDNIYMFENIELNVPYRIRITLNEDFIDTTDEFIVTDSNVIYVTDTDIGKPGWLKNGKYYAAMLNEPEKNIVFDLYTDIQHFFAIPSPFTDTAELIYNIEESSYVEIKLYWIDKHLSKVIYSETLQPGKYSLKFGDGINDGLYYLSLKEGGKTYICPFLKGNKGAPKKP
ncbi:MAG: hypothetical protein HZB41_14495 [Ignavibacteriae bacterium]|nr:hypothetical protein [Ignavibacteriota bacterium]